jgi:hypothetical protein
MLTFTLAVRFLLELGALVALGAWGFAAGGSGLARLVLGLGLPLVVAVLWSAFIGPGAGTPGAVKAVLQVAVFGAAAAALAVTRTPALATVFLAAVAVDAATMTVLED